MNLVTVSLTQDGVIAQLQIHPVVLIMKYMTVTYLAVCRVAATQQDHMVRVLRMPHVSVRLVSEEINVIDVSRATIHLVRMAAAGVAVTEVAVPIPTPATLTRGSVTASITSQDSPVIPAPMECLVL